MGGASPRQFAGDFNVRAIPHRIDVIVSAK